MKTFFLSQPPEEAPFSRRGGLQKTGSSGALGPSERRGAEGVLGLQRSASSSLLEKASSQVGAVKCVGYRLLPWGRQCLLCFSPVSTGQGTPSCQNNPYPCPESARALYPVSTSGWGKGTGLVPSWHLRSEKALRVHQIIAYSLYFFQAPFLPKLHTGLFGCCLFYLFCPEMAHQQP